VEEIIGNIDGTLSVFAERVVGGNYLDFDIDREEIARYAEAGVDHLMAAPTQPTLGGWLDSVEALAAIFEPFR